MFIVAIILAVVTALLALGAWLSSRSDHPDDEEIGGTLKVLSVVALVLTLVAGGISSIYSQDAGEVKVRRALGGTLVGQSVEPGFHIKAPWDSIITFDIRNNIVSYVGTGKDDHSGGSANGPQITFQDKDGVTGNLDLVVRYSLDPAQATEIYKEYGSQENFVARVITNDIRSIARNTPSKYGTLALFNSRDQVGKEIREALEERWANSGVVVDEVSLQEIRYSPEVISRFDEAQASRIAVDKARADQDAAKVAAETKVIEAQGVADANAVLTKSLTPEVLTQKYIDAIQNGTTFIVPEGSTPLVSVTK